MKGGQAALVRPSPEVNAQPLALEPPATVFASAIAKAKTIAPRIELDLGSEPSASRYGIYVLAAGLRRQHVASVESDTQHKHYSQTNMTCVEIRQV